uniref:Uncharacterized protein n=1 Tax=Glossina palpalis gambiensis TaxID=67801 RepID=A0A1B0B160_9MUSC
MFQRYFFHINVNNFITYPSTNMDFSSTENKSIDFSQIFQSIHVPIDNIPILFHRIASSFGCDVLLLFFSFSFLKLKFTLSKRKILTQEEKISAQFCRHYVN